MRKPACKTPYRRGDLSPEELEHRKKREERRQNLYKKVIDLEAFLREYDLDPDKNYKDDPTYGPTLRMLLKAIHLDQLRASSTLSDETFHVMGRQQKIIEDINKIAPAPPEYTRRQQVRYRHKLKRALRDGCLLDEAIELAIHHALREVPIEEKRRVRVKL